MAMMIGGRICCVLRLVVGVLFAVQVILGKSIPQLKLHIKILQESVVKRINEDVHAGWKASMNPRLANYTVSQFMHLLGVKPTPEGYLKSVPVVTYEKVLKLLLTFDARTAWPQCSTISDILECDPYNDNTGCSHPGCEPAYPTPKCERKCQKENLLWKKSKHFSVNAYRIHSDPRGIMAEVYNNGLVEVSFTVYELLANQWNGSWGDDGYFKIRRGTNECGIEGDVVAGMPSGRNVTSQYGTSDASLDATS